MIKRILICFILTFQTLTFAQLGFCTGSKGAPIFFENFGSGLDYGPALPSGTTSYTYVNSGFPQDGQYTLFHRTNLIPNSQNWLYSLDHTPDNDPNGLNGKCLIVNADFNPNQFFRRTVTGLCSNTTFEFSAWVLNILNASTNQQPINVAFEIWDATDTTLLKTGSTGVIPNSFTPIWRQYGMVFTLPPGQTSVILKIRNNFSGGLGNDFAIDDIMFRACGEFSTITNVGNLGNSITICQNETILNNILEVTTTGTGTNIYQWQQSADNVNFTDILGETAATYTIPTTLTSTTYYRVKVAEDVANINNNFCSALSEIFSIIINSIPNAPISTGNQNKCSNQNTVLSVTLNPNENANWYDAATGGTLLLANSTNFSTNLISTFYVESYNLSTTCKSTTRTPISVLPAVTINATNATICSGETTSVILNPSDSSYNLSWTATSNNVQGFSNGNGNTIAQTLTYSGTTFGTVTYIITPEKNGCQGIPKTVTITVNPSQTLVPVFSNLVTNYCLNATAPALPTQSSNATPILGTWSPATINTTTATTTTYTFTPQTVGCQNSQPFQVSISVGSSLSPNFDNAITICSGTMPPILNTTSPNGIIGTWNPSTINTTTSGSYVFTPNANQCAISQTIDVTVPNLTTMISNMEPTLCSGETTAITMIPFDSAINLNWTATSTTIQGFSNGTGTLINQTLTNSANSPGTVTYLVTPIKNGCTGTTQTVIVTVNPTETITPFFTSLATRYCLNGTIPNLPTQSENTIPILGSWSPSAIDNATLGTTTYIFSASNASVCQNIQPFQITITIGNDFSPNFEETVNLCENENPPILNTTSPNGISGTWNPSIINNQISSSYTFTPNPNECASSQTIVVSILQATLTSIEVSTSSAFSENHTISVLATSTGNYLYQLDNQTPQESPIFQNVTSGLHEIRVIDVIGCSQDLTKEVINIDYPSFFTPNGDGFNDVWKISNTASLQNSVVKIFDRYGKLLTQISANSSQGWNGTFNGQNLPADDYWFTIDFEEKGIQKKFRSHFSLKR